MVDSGLSDLAVRYKNINPDAKWKYIALYRVPDLSKLQDEKLMASIPKCSDSLPGKEPGTKGGDWPDVLENEIVAMETIQSFEGPNEVKQRGKGIVTVGMEPEQGSDQDFDDWYRKQVGGGTRCKSGSTNTFQHLDMISMCRGYNRSTRYKKLDGSEPRYFAIHEYATTDFPGDQLKIVVGTEWSQKVIKGAKAFVRDQWEYISEYRTGGTEKL